MPLYALNGLVPKVDAAAFVAPSAELIGQVSVAERASVWFGAVLRGDLEAITVGPDSNVQDGAVLHTDAGHPCALSEGVTVGHRAVVHGAVCGPGSLVGMGAVMLSGSSLGAGAVLGAGALLPGGAHVPDGMLALGVPARVVGPAPQGGHAARYVLNAARYNTHLQVVHPGVLLDAAAGPIHAEAPPLDPRPAENQALTEAGAPKRPAAPKELVEHS